MNVRVRFAPSPTGYLHIGGARTALYCYLYAKATGGAFVLRIEDTDEERSSREFEQMQIADLKWLGLTYDEGPDQPGKYGPYRQSERLDIYLKYAHQLIEKGFAFYDFCTEEELEEMRRANQEEGTPAYTGKWKNPQHWDEAKKRVAAGEKAPIRFLVPNKEYSYDDKVRGKITFPAGMIGDFVIIRSTGMPIYNFCCVVDDYLMKITHVIRGEDHVNNTAKQLMIYEALEADIPEFAHVSLLIGHDRQKLSKRHGATSVTLYREQSFLPEALANYLCLLGWSHPEEKDVFKLTELKEFFNLDRFNKAPAVYDMDKLKYINAQHLRSMELPQLVKLAEGAIGHGHFFHKQSEAWKESCMKLLIEKISLISEIEPLIEEFILKDSVDKNEKLDEILSWDTTPQIGKYILEQLQSVDTSFVTKEAFDGWMEYCKKDLKIKGKPLFMGFRGVLTGQDHGPDLKELVPLVPVTILKKRLEKIL